VPSVALLRRVFVFALALSASLAIAAARSPKAAAPAASCVQGGQPTWIDYADKWVPFRRLFFRPGLAVALAHTEPAAEARRHGAQVAYWTMSLRDLVGTPREPADPRRVDGVAARLASAAVKVTDCGTPVIALNELFGAHLRSPWSPTNTQYRANVLELARALAAHGAQPHLLISEGAATGGAAGGWWRSVAQSTTIIREVYISAPLLERRGASGATVYLRFQLRRAIRNFTTIGIPSGRVSLALGFHGGRGGRSGLPAQRWFSVVKREGLAARQVATELGVASVWSWGWARFAGAEADTSKRDAACVYLWARDPTLCDAPAVAGRGFDSSRVQPAERPGRGSVRFRVLSARHPVWLEVSASARLTARVAYVQQATAEGWRSLQRVVLAPFHPLRVRVPLADGRRVLRLYVTAESAPLGTAFASPPVVARVH
jgi:hypothetical protein